MKKQYQKDLKKLKKIGEILDTMPELKPTPEEKAELHKSFLRGMTKINDENNQSEKLDIGIMGFLGFLVDVAALLVALSMFFLPILLLFVHPILGIAAGLVYTYLAIAMFKMFWGED